MRPNLVFALLLAVSLAAHSALGGPGGELDPGFGEHGRILLQEAPFLDFRGLDVFVAPGSGKLFIVVAGSQGHGILRLNSDGSLDEDFGDHGLVLFDFGVYSLSLLDAQWLPDGKLLIAGVESYATPENVTQHAAVLRRVNADGTRDLSFGNGGLADLALGGDYESFSNILLQPDGRIVVLGYTNRTSTGERVLARFTPDGVIDSSFGNSSTPGVSVVDVTGSDASLKDIVRQTDGKIFICGEASSAPGNPGGIDVVAIRILPDGAPDSTFGNNGMLLIDGWQDSIVINSCLEQADGHLVFAGSFGSDGRERAAAWRTKPDGRLDAGFGSNGMAIIDTNTESRATVMMVMGDGALALAGLQWKPSIDWQRGQPNQFYGWSDMLVARIDPVTGSADQDFGNRGTTEVDFGTGATWSLAHSSGITQQPDGKLIVVGTQVEWYDWYPASSIAMARIDPYGSGSNGWVSMTERYLEAPATGGTVELFLRRTGGFTGALSVDFETVDNTATAGKDYAAIRGTATWPDGDFSDKSISISVSTAHLATSYEYFIVALSNSNGGLGMDQTTIGVSRISSSGAPPPKTRPDGPGSNGVRGGGVMGAELCLLLLLLFASRAARRFSPH